MTHRPNASTLGVMLLLCVGSTLGCATGTSMLATGSTARVDRASRAKAVGPVQPGQPVQHLEPVQPSAAQPKSPKSPESYAVARTPSMVGPQFVDPSAKVSGSPYQTVGHRRAISGTPLAGLASPGQGLPGQGLPGQGAGSGVAVACEPSGQAMQPEGACTCHAHGPYRPLFPNRIGGRLLACKGGCQVPHEGPCPEGPCQPDCELQSRCMDPQEYIFDGGDRDPPVRLREDLTQVGLDPEDTVIQYTTKTGMTEVQAGCRVAIYAPRFGSVRKRTGVLESELALRPQSADLPAGPGMIKEKLPPIQVSAPLKANTKDTVRVVEAFLDRQRPMPAELVLPMGEISDAFKPYEDLDIIRNGNIKITDPAKLAIATAAARIWSNIDALAVLIDGQEAAVLVDQKQPREFTLYEYKGARVRICKVASEQIANPGDIVSFTIRYDNIGEQPVLNLVVSDSLAPRLEYVESSQQSSIEARFSTSPNDAGSSVLRWEIDKELKPGEGGFVRFDVKVR